MLMPGKALAPMTEKDKREVDTFSDLIRELALMEQQYEVEHYIAKILNKPTFIIDRLAEPRMRTVCLTNPG